MRRHIPGHVRDSCPLREVVCEFCEGEVTASGIPIWKTVMSFLFPVRTFVVEKERKGIAVHLDKHCPLQKVQCAYWEHGCREEMERIHTDTHEREFLHIHFRLSMTKMEQKLNESTNRIAVMEKQISDKDSQIASLTKTLLSQLPTGRIE